MHFHLERIEYNRNSLWKKVSLETHRPYTVSLSMFISYERSCNENNSLGKYKKKSIPCDIFHIITEVLTCLVTIHNDNISRSQYFVFYFTINTNNVFVSYYESIEVRFMMNMIYLRVRFIKKVGGFQVWHVLDIIEEAVRYMFQLLSYSLVHVYIYHIHIFEW